MYNRYYPYPYNRSEELSRPPAPVITHPPPPIVPKPPLTPCPPPKSAISKKTQKKKINFKSFKKDTCTSLNDVECFLNNFNTTLKYIKLIKLLK